MDNELRSPMCAAVSAKRCSVIRLRCVLQIDRIARIEPGDTGPLARLVLRVIQAHEPLMGRANRGDAVSVSSADRGGVKGQCIDRRLQDQIQPVEAHLSCIGIRIAHRAISTIHSPGRSKQPPAGRKAESSAACYAWDADDVG